METEEQNIFSNFSKFRLPLALTIVGLTFLAAGIYFTLSKNSQKDIKITHSSEKNNASSSATIVVHIAGEVLNPGVYSLPFGSRVNELIQKAGGFSKEADYEFIDKIINLAQVLKDGQKIYIPKVGGENSSGSVVGVKTGSLVNINTATLAELDSLPDIGEARGKKIIEGRPYSSIEELVEKKIIPQSTFEKIKEKISIY